MKYNDTFEHRRGRQQKSANERLEKRITYNFEELQKMREETIEDVEQERLEHLENITLSNSTDDAEWMKHFISQSGNPCFVKISGIVTQVFH